jgi:arylsulfatase A-like enzyme
MRYNLIATLGVVALFTTLCHSQNTRSNASVDRMPSSSAVRPAVKQTPNILFIIMDDVGIDQLRIFGYGGGTPPATPNIDTIARAGIRFRNAWAMPECSPSRAMFFEGRYPLRTNVNQAILSTDLANSHVSPYEYTTPKILRTVGYQSGLFGKFHLGGPDNNPFGYGSPQAVGFDYFDGFMYGPPPIDPTIGGQFPNTSTYTSPYTCGFVPNSDFPAGGGADFGACYFSDGKSCYSTGTCTDLARTPQQSTPGRTCLEKGGLFVPKQTCGQPSTQPPLNFCVGNGYYVWQRVLDQNVVPLTDPSVRTYISEITNSSAISWINLQSAAQKPWMATVAYSNIHTPYQQPLTSLLPAGEPDTSGLSCTTNNQNNVGADRILSNQMAEAMDTEIGNLFVAIGLATYNTDGSLNYHPEATNTTVIIIGDNGTFAPGVKYPFDLSRAKGYVYQTGVWVPLIVAGPQVDAPGRVVSSMVNIADLFQFFGEIAGIDVHQVVPPSHILDSVPLMPYLKHRNQPSLRSTNFTQDGNNIRLTVPPPCVIPLTDPPTCIQLFNQQSICESEGGKWFPTYKSCCDIKNDPNGPYPDNLQVFPNKQAATRNDSYKFVQITRPDCSLPKYPDVTTNEFYKINEDLLNPLIDREGENLCASPGCPRGLSGQDLENYNRLSASQYNTLHSEPRCPGDGNEDKLVNQADLDNWSFYSQSDEQSGLTSSWYDFNKDGYTDEKDRAIILLKLGTNCLSKRK